MNSWDPWHLLDKAWMLLAGIIAWIANRHFADDRAVAKRLAIVESQHASRDDVTRLATSVGELGKTVAENHQEILKILLDRR